MDLSVLSRDELLARLKRLAIAERRCVAEMLACMAEIDRRHVLDACACPSLFDYCVKELKMTEDSAYRRLRAVRVAIRFPETYSLVREGLVSATTLALIEPHLRRDSSLLHRIAGKNRREVERIVAETVAASVDAASVEHVPPAPPDSIRFIPVRGTGAPSENSSSLDLFPAANDAAPAESMRVMASTVQAYVAAEFRFVASEAFAAAIEKLRAALWHKFPNGRLEDVLFEAVSEFLDRRDPGRPRRQTGPKPADLRARRAPASVQRQVRLRDGERCAFVAADGRRCAETRGLEIDHIVPWSLGGPSDDPGNLRLLCRAHNQAEARRLFGAERVGPRRDSG